MAQADDAGWLEGRTRHVRVYLTEEEHALVRQAAALADRSVSRFSIEAIVEAARGRLARSSEVGSAGEPTEEPAPKGKKGRRKKGG